MPSNIPHRRPHRRVARALLGFCVTVTTTSAAVLAVAGPASAQPSTFVVNSTADEHDSKAADGLCESRPGICTLRAAIEETARTPGSTITVPPGIYTLSLAEALTVVGPQNGLLGHDVTIVGAGSGRTIISGGSLTRVFDIAAGAVIAIDGVTIQDGRVTKPGFALHSHGAGIHNHGTLVLRNSTLYHNVVPPSADGQHWGGGGITNAKLADATLVNVTLFANTTQDGEGAGIENYGTMRMTHVTVGLEWNGTAGPAGQAAVYNDPVGTLVAENSIFQRALATCGTGRCDSAPNCRGIVTGYSMSNDTTCSFGYGHDGLDAQLGPFDSATHVFPMTLASPALDIGMAAANGGRDQLGRPRPTDGNCNGSIVEDLGAVEYQPQFTIAGRVVNGCSLTPLGPVTRPVLRIAP